jgi:hypothetical protein
MIIQTGASVPISGSFPQEAEARFPLDGGGWVSVGRGVIHCEYGFAGVSSSERSLEDHVLAWLEVCGNDGRVLRLERAVRANLLLELVRLGQPIDNTSELKPLLCGVRCWHDRRRYIPTVASGEDHRAYAFAYFAEGLAPLIDLLKGPLGLVVRVHPVEGGGIGGARSPRVTVQTTVWGPRVVLWPSLIHDALDPLMPLVAFQRTERRGEPQPFIQVV